MSGPDADISIDELVFLLNTCARACYKVTERETEHEEFVFKCMQLISSDYIFSIIANDGGELCPHYPSSIIITEKCKGSILENNISKTNGGFKKRINAVEFTKLLQKSRFARYRTHFPVPVIQFDGKYICRSATLAESPDNYSEEDLEKFYHVRDLDLNVLRTYSIGHICDLMVEKTKIKYGIKVASSEKIDKHKRYSEFMFSTIPYPGCEYFTDWRENGYKGEGMIFDWNQPMVDVELELPLEKLKDLQFIDWSKYKEWDLIELTQNYIKLFLHLIISGENGLLMHCISGWHRTPMFISLLRLSLWADMEIHQSLGPIDILYLTVAYDWFLFGHNFQCLVKGEDIFVFCFNFIKHITSDEFSTSSFKSLLTRRELDSKVNKDIPLENESGSNLKLPNRDKSVPVEKVLEASKQENSTSDADFLEQAFYSEDSPRKQRLDAVRKIFLNNFRCVNGQKIPENPATLRQQMESFK